MSQPEQPPYVFVEIPHGQGPRTVHFVAVPGIMQRDGYRQLTSLGAFNSGKLRGATKQQRAQRRDRCCWAPHALYYGKRHEEWLADQEHRATFECGGKRPLAVLDERLLQPVHHANLWGFYRHIGFDWHLRRYTGAAAQVEA